MDNEVKQAELADNLKLEVPDARFFQMANEISMLKMTVVALATLKNPKGEVLIPIDHVKNLEGRMFQLGIKALDDTGIFVQVFFDPPDNETVSG